MCLCGCNCASRKPSTPASIMLGASGTWVPMLLLCVQQVNQQWTFVVIKPGGWPGVRSKQGHLCVPMQC
jgi:hypothetical protein